MVPNKKTSDVIEPTSNVKEVFMEHSSATDALAQSSKQRETVLVR